MTARRRRGSSRPPRTAVEWAWAVGFPLLLVVAGYAGYRIARGAVETVLDSREGIVTDTLIDPSAPGYRTVVDPTATGALAYTVDGELAGVGVALPAGEAGGGTWLVVPPDAVGVDDRTLASAHRDGEDALWESVAAMIGVEFTHELIVDEAGLAELVAPVAPLSLGLADPLIADGEVVHPAGVGDLDADEVGAVLAWLNPGESIGNRFTRHEELIDVWLGAVAAGGGAGLVGDVAQSDLIALVEVIAMGPVVVEAIPLEATTVTADGETGLQVDVAATRALVRDLVPFARPAATTDPPTALVLNGANNDLAVTLDLARRLGAAGAQVTAVGNDASFLRDETVLAYADEQLATTAADLVDAMGIGRAELDANPNPAFDLRLLVGADALEAP